MQQLKIPEVLIAPLNAIVAAGGDPWIVGGAVRDHIMGLEPKDFDVESFNISMEDLAKTLAPFGRVDTVGKFFGVVKLFINHQQYDFSVPRRERKTGEGHQAFDVTPDPSMSMEQAALRRDFTCNAIYYHPIHHHVYDPTEGVQDIQHRILRHTSDAFAEDPLRVLRAFQFCSRFNFGVHPDTVEMCRKLRTEFHTISKERIWVEWEKWATKSTAHHNGLKFLRECGWLELFPHIHNLVGIRQEPDHHPEGDVWTHTLFCLDAISRVEVSDDDKLVVALAVLTHDLGKITHTQIREDGKITSYGHDLAGVPLAKEFLKAINTPKSIRDKICPLVANHMFRNNVMTDRIVRRLSMRIQPATIRQLCLVMECDSRGRPPKPDVCHPAVVTLRNMSESLNVHSSTPQPILMGRHLIEEGVQPGPNMGDILSIAMDGQVEGKFKTVAGGLTYLREKGIIPRKQSKHWWKWRFGRLGTGYKISTLFRFGNIVDSYLIKVEEGVEVPAHLDEVKGRDHYRFNIHFGRYKGGKFHSEDYLVKIFSRVFLFRPDIHKHNMDLVKKGTVWIWSVGWSIPSAKERLVHKQ